MNSLSQVLYTVSYMALPLLLAVVLHECAHGWVAQRSGDPTAKLAGRLTLNPAAHVDPFGTVLLPLICVLLPGSFFIGWAKPVPIDPSRFRRPRRDMAFVAAAGPLMNLLLAAASATLAGFLLFVDPDLAAYLPPQPGLNPPRDLGGVLLFPLLVMAIYSVFVNVLLMLFNLIPVPPLDGGRILASLLPPRSAHALRRLEPYGMFIIIGLIVLDPQIHVIRTLVGTLGQAITGSLMGVTGAIFTTGLG